MPRTLPSSPCSYLLRWCDPHHTVLITIDLECQIFYRPAVFLDAHRKTPVSAPPIHAQRQISFDIRTAIGGVVVLIVLLVSQHVNPVKIRLAGLMWFF